MLCSLLISCQLASLQHLHGCILWGCSEISPLLLRFAAVCLNFGELLCTNTRGINCEELTLR